MNYKIAVLLLIILTGCSNPPAPKEKEVKKVTPVKNKASSVKPASNFWSINSFSSKEGRAEGSKYLKFVTEGNFSDSTETRKYLYGRPRKREY
jgi:hypothetical protein